MSETYEPTVVLSVSELKRLMGGPGGLFFEGCRCPVCATLRAKLEPLGVLPAVPVSSRGVAS